jgi:hypothetical protein
MRDEARAFSDESMGAQPHATTPRRHDALHEPIMRTIAAHLALLGLVSATAAHIAALAGIDVQTAAPFVWALHPGIFLALPAVIMAAAQSGERKTLWGLMRDGLPRVVAVTGGAVLAYAMMNFVLFMGATEGGSTVERDGRFLLENHGALIREITVAEYTAFRANEIRGFSGHWIAFYYIAFAFLRFFRVEPVDKRASPASTNP